MQPSRLRRRNMERWVIMPVVMFIAACAQPASHSRQATDADATPATSEHATSPPRLHAAGPITANAALDDSGVLVLHVGEHSLRLNARNCREDIPPVVYCDEAVKLTVTSDDGRVRQVLPLEAIHVNREATFYRGELTDAFVRQGQTFVMADVNADGPEDLLIMTGREGNYGGPSYDVFLFDAANRRYVHSPAFSELTVGYNGLFSIESGKLKVSATDGCCYHVFDVYEVRGGTPILIERVTEDRRNADAPRIVKERLVEGRMLEVKDP